jgi:hypothetical protein
LSLLLVFIAFLRIGLVSQDLDFYLQSNEGGADGDLRVSIVNLVEMLMEKICFCTLVYAVRSLFVGVLYLGADSFPLFIFSCSVPDLHAI